MNNLPTRKNNSQRHARRDADAVRNNRALCGEKGTPCQYRGILNKIPPSGKTELNAVAAWTAVSGKPAATQKYRETSASSVVKRAIQARGNIRNKHNDMLN